VGSALNAALLALAVGDELPRLAGELVALPPVTAESPLPRLGRAGGARVTARRARATATLLAGLAPAVVAWQSGAKAVHTSDPTHEPVQR
jgi:hypothetical protein